MDVVDFLFPLLSLKPEVVIFIIKCMDEIDIISFSLISRKTRDIVAAIGFEASGMYLGVCEGLVLDFKFGTTSFYFDLTEWNEEWREGIDEPYDMAVANVVNVGILSNLIDDVQIEKPNFQIKDWVGHFMFIFHKRLINYLDFGSSDCRFTFESISREFKRNSVKNLVMPSAGTQTYKQQLIDHFQASQISISLNTFPNYENVLIRSHDLVRFKDEEGLTLDNLLITNSKAIYIYYGQTLMKTLNKFIKLWQVGSNPCLQCLVIHLNEMWLPQDLFNRIKFSEVHEDVEMQFPEFDEFEIVKKIVRMGGYSIYNSKGQRALFYFQNDRIEMLIPQ